MSVCGLLVGTAPALAVQAHIFSGAFGWHVDRTTGGNVCTVASGDECGPGEAGSEPGQFSGPLGVAVNTATNALVEPAAGDVYVVDSRNNRVEQFNAAGIYIGQFNGSAAPTGRLNVPEGIAVDNSGDPLDPSAGDVYVTSGQLIYKFSANGVYLGQLSETEPGSRLGEVIGVAVDAAGALWVYERSSAGNLIDSFSNALANVFLTKRDSPFGASLGFAVDSEDNLYVNRGARVFAKLNSSGEVLEEEVVNQVSTAAAVDLSSNDVYIDNESSIGEFSASGSPVFRFGAGLLTSSAGVGINSSDGTVYVSDEAANEVFAFKQVLLADVTTGAASGLGETTATLAGTVNPVGVPVSGCAFEYGTSASYGQSAPCAALPGSGGEPVPVDASLTGLTPRTLYHYRLTATNANGTSYGLDGTFTTPTRPAIEESVADVTSSSATLGARINPGGADTRYRFEYGPSTAYGSSVPVPDGDLGSGTADIAQSALIEGLSAGTSYHYRVVAHNSVGTVEGPDRVFVTQAGEASGLLDGRAWEMVSPPDKRGASLEALGNTVPSAGGNLIQVARTGGAITYGASGPIDNNPAGNRNIALTQVLSTRGPDGWVSRGIATPNEPPIVGLRGVVESEYRFFSDDLSVGLVEPAGETPLSPAASERTLYRREVNGEYTPLVTAANVPPGTEFSNNRLVVFGGATPDLSHVILSSTQALTAGFVSHEKESLYEWSGGQLRLASVLPDGRAAAEEGMTAHLGLVKL